MNTRNIRLVLVAFIILLVSCAGQGSTLDVGDGPLVYVPMGNSLTFYPSGDGVIVHYAAMLKDDFGVEVEMRDHTVGSDRTDSFLARLQSNERLRSDLAEADVITMDVPNDEWSAPIQTAIGRDPAACGGDDNQQCLRDMVDYYKSHVDAIFEALTAIADPSKTLIRAQDFYVFPTNAYTDETFAIVYPYWKEAQDYVGEVAAEYGIPVAKVFDDFMGPDGTKNPEQLIGPDHVHANAVGVQRIAELIHDLGYGLAS